MSGNQDVLACMYAQLPLSNQSPLAISYALPIGSNVALQGPIVVTDTGTLSIQTGAMLVVTN